MLLGIEWPGQETWSRAPSPGCYVLERWVRGGSESNGDAITCNCAPADTYYLTCSNICVPLSSFTSLPVEVITDPLVLFEAAPPSDRPRRPITPWLCDVSCPVAPRVAPLRVPPALAPTPAAVLPTPFTAPPAVVPTALVAPPTALPAPPSRPPPARGADAETSLPSEELLADPKLSSPMLAEALLADAASARMLAFSGICCPFFNTA